VLSLFESGDDSVNNQKYTDPQVLTGKKDFFFFFAETHYYFITSHYYLIILTMI